MGNSGAGRAVSGGRASSGRLSRLLQLGRDQDAKAVLLHQLGHVVGLAHVTEPT
jgi:hypothetical protein